MQPRPSGNSALPTIRTQATSSLRMGHGNSRESPAHRPNSRLRLPRAPSVACRRPTWHRSHDSQSKTSPPTRLWRSGRTHRQQLLNPVFLPRSRLAVSQETWVPRIAAFLESRADLRTEPTAWEDRAGEFPAPGEWFVPQTPRSSSWVVILHRSQQSDRRLPLLPISDPLKAEGRQPLANSARSLSLW